MRKVGGQLVAGLLASFLVASITITGLTTNQRAYGNEIYTLLIPDNTSSMIRLVADRTLELRYLENSSVTQMLAGENKHVRFTLNSSDSGKENGMNDLINKLNQVIHEKNSPLTVESVALNYVAAIKNVPQGTLISYRIEMFANVTGYTLQQGIINATDGKETPAIVDLDWRDIVVREPITTQSEFGEININHPIGLLQVTHPELAKLLLDSGAKEIMEDPILNFGKLNLPMNSWHYLFDVTGKQVPQYFEGEEGRTLSIYSIGESSFREGVYKPEVKDATVSISGTEVKIHAQTPPPSGQISIAGYSSIDHRGETELAVVYSKDPKPTPNAFSFQVLLVLGGMMGAIAIIVLFKARK